MAAHQAAGIAAVGGIRRATELMGHADRGAQKNPPESKDAKGDGLKYAR